MDARADLHPAVRRREARRRCVIRGGVEPHSGRRARARSVGHRVTIPRAFRRHFRSGTPAVTAPSRRKRDDVRPSPAHAFRRGAAFNSASTAQAGSPVRGLAGRRVASYCKEAEPKVGGGAQNTTARGQDKSAQGAARSVVCFYSYFSPIWQCSTSMHNVRLTTNPLLQLSFPHGVVLGDG